MSYYCVIDVDVKDREQMAHYSRQVGNIVRQHGGRYLARSSNVAAIEGDWHPTFLAILEFPDGGALQRFYDSADYAPLKAIRMGAATANSIGIESLPAEPVQT
jgi:uncharacterized protein (DUF1330 family)